ncbi:hypothetical protein ACKWTF_016382 [Chironomus riparius]
MIVSLKSAFVYLLLIKNFTIAPLPTIFPVCFRDDPHISDCLIQSVKMFQLRMTTGDLGDGFKVPRLDPLYIPKLKLGIENVLHTTMEDMNLRGFSKCSIEKLHVNMRDLKFDMIITIPQMDIVSNYKMEIRLLPCPLDSEGVRHEVMENVKIRIIMKGRLYQKNGQNYLKFDPIYFKILESSVKLLELTNFLPGFIIAPIFKAYFQLNADFLFKTLYPDFEKNLSKIFTGAANQIVSNAPFDEIFPY